MGGTVTEAAFRLGPPCTARRLLWEGGERVVWLSQTNDAEKDPSWRVGHCLLRASVHLSIPNRLNFFPLLGQRPTLSQATLTLAV